MLLVFSNVVSVDNVVVVVGNWLLVSVRKYKEEKILFLFC